MITFWIAAAILAGLAGLWLAQPFLKKRQMEILETDSVISIYRDQLDEVERDCASGLIDEVEAEAAREEIEFRALQAAKRGGSGMSVSQRNPMVAGIIFVVVSATGVAGYTMLGSPTLPDQPLAGRRTETLTQHAQAGDINAQIQLLADKTAANPDSLENWLLLARAYASIEDNAQAAEAYRHAAELSDNDPIVLSAYGEAMTLANGNKVPPAARVIFEQVVNKVDDPRARYYMSLARAQAKDFEGALQGWAALAADSPDDAPWMPLVRRDIINMARFLETDVRAYLPNATPEEIVAAGGTAPVEDKAATAARVTELTAALETNPKDYKGWIELAQLQAQQGKPNAARQALDSGREQFAAAPFVLGEFDKVASALGLKDQPGVSGPDAEDIANAQDMSEEEQAEMVDGMVSGLAERLKDNPNNPDGWIMLVRSYSVMGLNTKAVESYDAALAHFRGQDDIVTRIRLEAGGLITRN
jgi:cytochrome c-type biogenesis protein CcmH